jgi:ribosome-associated protein
MDIKKLQALVVDALEDVKAQDIRVYDTTHLTSMFDRIAIASGTSNRQTKALASSVRDKVKSAGGDIVNMEGEGTGEWVLVDLGDMVVHIMQPAIRAYYRLEEIWGEKEVNLAAAKRATTPRKTVAKADGKAPAKKVASKVASKVAAKAPAKKAAAKTATKTAVKRGTKTATKTAATTAPKPATKRATQTAAKAPTKTAAKQAPAKTAAKKAAPRRAATKSG